MINPASKFGENYDERCLLTNGPRPLSSILYPKSFFQKPASFVQQFQQNELENPTQFQMCPGV